MWDLGKLFARIIQVAHLSHDFFPLHVALIDIINHAVLDINAPFVLI